MLCKCQIINYICRDKLINRFKLNIMKKVLLVAVLGMLTLASCKKSYTCSCTSILTMTTADETAKGSDAATACADASSSTFGIPTKTCVAK